MVVIYDGECVSTERETMCVCQYDSERVSSERFLFFGNIFFKKAKKSIYIYITDQHPDITRRTGVYAMRS